MVQNEKISPVFKNHSQAVHQTEEQFLRIVFGSTHRTRVFVFSSMVIGIALLLVNFEFFAGSPQLFSMINMVSALIILGPSLLLRYNEYKSIKEVESRFPDFLRDVTEAIGAGMTLPQAMKNTLRNKYGMLTPYVRQMAVQIDWGVPFESILKQFAENTGSKILRRTVATIIETHRSGGNITDVLQAVGKSIIEVDKIKKERSSHIYAQMLTGYTIFFVFLGVMIGLQRFLIPSLSFVGSAEIGAAAPGIADLAKTYKELFMWLIVIQGFFSGIAIGKMAEGAFAAGFKHALVLVAIGYTAFVLFA